MQAVVGNNNGVVADCGMKLVKKYCGIHKTSAVMALPVFFELRFVIGDIVDQGFSADRRWLLFLDCVEQVGGGLLDIAMQCDGGFLVVAAALVVGDINNIVW